MRTYSTLTAQLWIGKTGKLLRTKPKECRILQVYLVTAPIATMYGLYYLPETIALEETGLTREELHTAWLVLNELKFAHFDPETQHVWVREMARYQMNAPLKDTDRRVRGVNDWYQALPSVPWLRPFYDRYWQDLCLEHPRDYAEQAGPAIPHHLGQPVDQASWEAVLRQLALRVNRHSFYTWFKDSILLSDDGVKLIVQVPTTAHCDWLAKHYLTVVEESLVALEREDARVQFVAE